VVEAFDISALRALGPPCSTSCEELNMPAIPGSNNEARPRFEFYPAGSPTLRSVEVDPIPFTIGRGEGTELQLNSTSVSREHARVVRSAAGYRIRDLGSTNGTTINGEPITEARLNDGDSVRIADIELTFVCSALGRIHRMATQPLARSRQQSPSQAIADEIANTRALGETLLWQSIPLERASIVEFPSGREQAAIVSIGEPLAAQLDKVDTQDRQSTAARLHELGWRIAALGHANLSAPGSSLLLHVGWRANFDGRLFDALAEAADCAPAGISLGVVVPWEWATDSPASLKLCAELNAKGALVAFDQFKGGSKCVEAMEIAAPDYLVIDAAVARGVATEQRRLQRLKVVRASCDDAGIRVVLPADLPTEDYDRCFQLGFNLLVQPTPAAARAERPALAAELV